MNEPAHISAFLLERYHIGEITSEERLIVENAMLRDPGLAESLAELGRSDQNFRERYPQDLFFGDRLPLAAQKTRRFGASPSMVWKLSAAALVLVIALPLLILRNNPANAGMSERSKGVPGRAELSIYLKVSSMDNSVKLPDQADIQAGNTIQLVYQVAEKPSGTNYGMIFSIDGRSLVTMHYPYYMGQSTQLVSGRAVPLDEAYTLDDAPDYEIFFFVVGEKPLEIRNALETAEQLARQISGNPQKAGQFGKTFFKGYELQILTLWKE